MTTQTKDLLAGIKTKIGSVAHIQEAIRPMLIDEIMSDIEAIRASATSAPEQTPVAAIYQHTDGRIGQPSSLMLARGVPTPPEWTVMEPQPDRPASAGNVIEPLSDAQITSLAYD